MPGIERWYSKFDGICDDLLSDEEEKLDRTEKERLHNLAQHQMEKLKATPKPPLPSKRCLTAVKEGVCSICGKAFLWETLKRCQRCFRSPFYCSEKCQKKDLRRHKKEDCVPPADTTPTQAEQLYRSAEIAADHLFHFFQARINDDELGLFDNNVKGSLRKYVQVSKMLLEPGMTVIQIDTVGAMEAGVVALLDHKLVAESQLMHVQLPLSSCNDDQCREEYARVEDAIRRAKLDKLWQWVYLEQQFLLGIFVGEIDTLFLAVLDVDPPANMTMPKVSAASSLAMNLVHQVQEEEAFHDVQKLMSDMAVGSSAKNINCIIWLRNIFDDSRDFYTRTELKNKMTAKALKKALKRVSRRRCNNNNGSEWGCIKVVSNINIDRSAEDFHRVSQFVADPDFVVVVFYWRPHIQSLSAFQCPFVFRAVVEN